MTELLDHGSTIVNSDRRRGPSNSPNAPFVETYFSDVDQVAGLLRDCDSLVHLGAISLPLKSSRRGRLCLQRIGLRHGLEQSIRAADPYGRLANDLAALLTSPESFI